MASDIETEFTSVTGLDELEKRLAGLASFVESDILKKATKAACELVAAEARELAPRRSGKLAAGIAVKAGRSKPGRFSYLVTVAKGLGVGDTFYGAFQEFGWKSGKRRGGRSVEGNRKPNPGEHYLQYASESKAEAGVQIIIDTANKLIDAEGK